MNQHDQTSGTVSGSDRALSPSFADAEELIAHARQRYATGFPNPQRVGCPVSGALQNVVRAERLPDDDLQTHLFRCSECFNEYHAAIVAHRRQRATQKPASWWRVWLAAWRMWQRPLWAGACAVLLLAAVVWIWRERTATVQVSQTQPTPVATATVAHQQPESAGATTAQPSPPVVGKPALAADELLAVSLDLNDFRALGAQRRSSAGQEAAPIKLPAARLSLLLTLREPQTAGGYRISILDATDHTLAVARARSRAGQHLSVTLDLRRLANQGATLRLERAQQADVAPEDYRLLIVRP